MNRILYSVGNFLKAGAFAALFVLWSKGWQVAVGVAAATFAIGYVMAQSESTRRGRVAERFREHRDRVPWEGTQFDVSISEFADAPLSAEEQFSATHRFAKALSVEFWGMTVNIVDGTTSEKAPRRERYNITKDVVFKPTGTEKLDNFEQTFWVRVAQLRLRSQEHGSELIAARYDPESAVPRARRNSGNSSQYHVRKTCYYLGKLRDESSWMFQAPAFPDSHFNRS